MSRFTIRELVLLTLVIAMGVGWGLEYRHRGPENTRLREQNQKLLEMRQHWLSENQRLTEQQKKWLDAWPSVMKMHNEQSASDTTSPQLPSPFTGLRPVPGIIDESPHNFLNEQHLRDLWRQYPELFDESDSESAPRWQFSPMP